MHHLAPIPLFGAFSLSDYLGNVPIIACGVCAIIPFYRPQTFDLKLAYWAFSREARSSAGQQSCVMTREDRRTRRPDTVRGWHIAMHDRRYEAVALSTCPVSSTVIL